MLLLIFAVLTVAVKDTKTLADAKKQDKTESRIRFCAANRNRTWGADMCKMLIRLALPIDSNIISSPQQCGLVFKFIIRSRLAEMERTIETGEWTPTCVFFR